MGLALTAALLVRLLFPVGLVGGYPQDDAIYITIAQNILGGDHGWQHYHHLPDAHVANPANWFNFRVLFTYPLAAALRLFGPGDAAATLIPTLSSIVTAASVAGIASDVFGRRAAVPAAWLAGFFPLEVIVSSRVLVDSPFVAWLALAGWLVLRASREEQAARDTRADLAWLAAGTCLGAAYLTKVVAVHAGAIIALPALALATRPGRRLRSIGLLLAPPAFVFIAEGAFYGWVTGRFWLHTFILRSALAFKITHEDVAMRELLPGLRIAWEGYFNSYLPLFFGWGRVPPCELSAAAAPVFWTATLASIVLWRKGDARLRALILTFIGLCLLLEAIPGSVRQAEDGGWQLFLVPRQERFIPVAAAFAAALAAGALTRLDARRPGWRILPITLGVVLFYYAAALRSYQAYWRDSLADLRRAAEVVAAVDSPVYSDLWGVQLLDHYLGRANDDSRRTIEPETSITDITGGIVVLGGGRGIELSGDVVRQSLPDWARRLADGETAPPEGWIRIVSREGEIRDDRQNHLAIYAVPPRPKPTPSDETRSEVTPSGD